MSARFPILSSLAGVAVLGGASVGVLAFRGSGPEALRGVALGAGLGALGAVLEAVMVVRAFSFPRGDALRIVLAGFGGRLIALVAGTLLLRATGFADPLAFALSFVGGFLAGVPAFASAVSGRSPAGGAR